MAYPPRYDRSFGFADFQVASPVAPPPGGSIDAQLDAVAASINSIRAFLMEALTAEGTLPGSLPGGTTLTGFATSLLAQPDETGWLGLLGFTPFTRSLRTAVDQAAFRAAIGLGGLTSVDLLRLRNRILNPAMQVSQERGNSPLDVTSGVAYVLDQWTLLLNPTPGGTLRGQRVLLASPGGSPFRLRATVQGADGAIAASDVYIIQQPIEGLRVADARFGSAAARQVVLRIGVRSSVAGTFGVSIGNDAGSRSWVGLAVVAPADVNQDILRSFVIPGDTVGAWAADTNVGMRLRVCLAAGTGFQGAPGWQAGNIVTTAAQTNLMATAGATFDLFDVGLYVDPLNLGLLPPFDVPDAVNEERECQRYFYQVQQVGAQPVPRINLGVGVGDGSGGFIRGTIQHPVPMRVSPSVSFGGQWRALPGGSVVAAPTINDGSFLTTHWQIASTPPNNAAYLIQGGDANTATIVANARMS